MSEPIDPRNPIDPFALFCAYHLGLDAEGRFRHRNIHDVARIFRRDVQTIEKALVANGMDAARMLNLDFDLAGAQLDMQASPPGVDLPLLAQMHWDLFQNAPEKKRDWRAEHDEDERINAETFRKPSPPATLMVAMTRNPMAPDTEPTDEELSLVMREARDEAMRKRGIAMGALAAQISAAVDEAIARRQQRVRGGTRGG